MEPNLKVTFAAPWRVELVEEPAPQPGEGEALIATRTSLISTGTELTLLSGEGWSPLSRPGFRLPQVGYSNVGTVIEVGAGVDPSWIGRRVASRSVHARYALCRVDPTPGQWRSGVFAVPSAMTDEEATLFALGVTALNGLRRGAPIAGQRLTIIGLGLLGQLAVRAALSLGAAEIAAVGRGPARLAFLPQDARVTGLAGGAEAAGERAGERDLVVEVTGEPTVVGPSLALVRKGGRLVLLGSGRGASTLDLHALCCRPYRTIIGADIESLPAQPEPGDDWCIAAAARAFFDELAPVLRASPALVTHRFAATDAADAYATLRKDPAKTLACTLDWQLRGGT